MESQLSRPAPAAALPIPDMVSSESVELQEAAHETAARGRNQMSQEGASVLAPAGQTSSRMEMQLQTAGCRRQLALVAILMAIGVVVAASFIYVAVVVHETKEGDIEPHKGGHHSAMRPVVEASWVATSRQVEKADPERIFAISTEKTAVGSIGPTRIEKTADASELDLH